MTTDTQIETITIQLSTDEPTSGPSLSREQLQALEHLIVSQQTRLKNFVRKHLRQDDFVEDVIQQTHMAAFRNWERFRGDSKPETWLFGIALNLVRNFRYRDDSYRYYADDMEQELEQLPADPGQEPEEALMRVERIEKLRAAINDLPVKMQSVVQLVLLEGLSYQDAALELDLPIGTVRSRLSRARDMLRVDMDGWVSHQIAA